MKSSFIFLLSIFLCSCAKDRHDQATYKPIHGIVYNQCNDSGLAEVELYLKAMHDDKLLRKYQTTSTDKGYFRFDNVELKSGSHYEYVIDVPSQNNLSGSELRVYFMLPEQRENTLDLYYMPRVIPASQSLCFGLPAGTILGTDDSVTVYAEQRTFHKNAPALPYNNRIGSKQLVSGNCTVNFPMGWWHLTINKWKKNTHTMEQDSIYLGWGASKTYLVNW